MWEGGVVVTSEYLTIFSRIVNAAAGVISSFSQDFYFFLILRFLSGVGSV